MNDVHVIVTGPEEAYNDEAEFWCASEMMAFTVLHEGRLHLRIDPRPDGLPWLADTTSLAAALTEAYQVSGAALDALFAAAEQADQEAIDLYGFTSVLKRHLDAPARLAFIGLLWDVVYADGERHELEDNTVWRIAELIGVDAPSRVAERQRARARTPGTPRETGSDD